MITAVAGMISGHVRDYSVNMSDGRPFPQLRQSLNGRLPGAVPRNSHLIRRFAIAHHRSDSLSCRIRTLSATGLI